jgi:DNA adenine methylase
MSASKTRLVTATCEVYGNETLREEPVARPFLKTVGGKTQLLPELLARVPASFKMYFEPFVGGGALFFALAMRGVLTGQAVLGDTNRRLVRTYRGVRDHVETVIGLLEKRRYEEKQYYAVRAMDPDLLGDAGVAAWMIYLNKTGFNGLYRVNRDGRFNVPFGRYTNPTICDTDNLRACSKALQGVEITTCDFTAHAPRRGDFIYFDPPYLPVSKTSNFRGYTADGFTLNDQYRLRDHALTLKQKGVHVLLSNSIAAKEIYEGHGFTIDVVHARRNVNSKATSRGAVEEILVT